VVRSTHTTGRRASTPQGLYSSTGCSRGGRPLSPKQSMFRQTVKGMITRRCPSVPPRENPPHILHGPRRAPHTPPPPRVMPARSALGGTPLRLITERSLNVAPCLFEHHQSPLDRNRHRRSHGGMEEGEGAGRSPDPAYGFRRVARQRGLRALMRPRSKGSRLRKWGFVPR
jgi:hypothetical protein